MELTLTMSMAMAVMVTVVAILVLGSLVRPRRSQRKTLNLPPGPRGWPVFGSLSLLVDTLPPHRVLAELAPARRRCAP